jgi:hypothetical protein
MGVVIEICVKYPGGLPQINLTDMERGVRSPAPSPAFLCVDCFFLSSRIGCVLSEDDGGLYFLFFSNRSKRRAKRDERVFVV